MEPKEKYTTRIAVEIVEYRCPNPKCEIVYGYGTPDGYLNLRGSDLMIKDIEIARCKCAICGATIKWYSTDYRMKRLLKGRKK